MFLARVITATVTSALVATAAVGLGSSADAATPYHPSSIPVSATGGGVAFAPDGRTSYATDSGSHSVAVVDTATRTQTATIPVGSYPSGIAISADGSTLVVANQGSDSVSVVAASTGTVTATVPVGEYPTSVAITPDGTRAFVVDLGDNDDDGELDVVDLATAAVVSTTPLGIDPQGVAFTPDGTRAVVANAGRPGASTAGSLSVIDARTAAVVGTIAVGATPDAVAVSPDGTTAYATNFTSRTLSVVDLASGTETRTVPVGVAPGDLAVSADGSRVYVANAGDTYGRNGSVSIVDTASDTVTSTVPVVGTPLGVGVSPDGGVVYVPTDAHTISIVDTATMAWTPTVARIAGPGRYETAAAVAQAAYPGTVPVAYVATGTNFPDALSAAAAAAELGGPLLLTDPGTLPTATRTELTALRPTKVIVVGGVNAVSPTLFGTLSTLAASWHGTVVRQSGGDRYATGQTIVQNAFASATRVFVATGQNYPDALSASAAAGSAGEPVVLVDGGATGLDTDTIALLRHLGATEFDIAGGTSAVSPGIASDLATLGTVHRFAGADRFATSALIDRAAFPAPTSAYEVTGTQFPDALAGAVLAAVRHAPLAVVQPSCVPSATADGFADAGVRSVTLIGGTTALTPALESQAICG